MKKNLKILVIEDKVTQSGREYIRVNTSEGWLSCFDTVTIEKLKEMGTGTGSFEVIEAGEYKNIKKMYDVVEDGKVNAPVQKIGTAHTTMYVSYVKDLIVAGKTPAEAIELIKKIRNEF